MSLRCEVWDACSALTAAVSVRLLVSLCSPSFPLSVQPVSFVSRVSYCLLELDSKYELVVSSAARAPASFASNRALHASQQFLTYVELPSTGECGAVTEYVQWRRRVCELRARGWGYCHTAAASDGQLTASASPAGVQWRIDRSNGVARDQSRKNFTPVTADSERERGRAEEKTGLMDIAQLRERLLKETESKGVQLLLGNAPPQLDWESYLPRTDPRHTDFTSASCVALLRFLCLLFGALRRGGDFAFLLTGAEELLMSPLLQSVLRLLARCFSLVALHRCAVSVGVYGSGEVWLVGKGFTAGHAEKESELLRIACSQLLANQVDSESLSSRSLHSPTITATINSAAERNVSLRVRTMDDRSGQSPSKQHTALTPARHMSLPSSTVWLLAGLVCVTHHLAFSFAPLLLSCRLLVCSAECSMPLLACV